MSIADKITSLTTARNDIRSALQQKGIATAISHGFSSFASDILNIKTGVLLQSKSVTPGKNAKTVSPDSGYDGLSSVSVSGDADLVASNIKSGVNIFGVAGSLVPGITPSGTKNITANGTVDVTNYASVNVAVPVKDNYQSKIITPGYSLVHVVPDSGFDALSDVSVNGDTNLISENIKKDIVIFGVTGNYEGGGGDVCSLIVCTCSSNIYDVSAKYGTKTAVAHMVGNTAYMNIPYTYTGSVVVSGRTSARTISTTITVSNINIYTCSLLDTGIIYNAGTWNIGAHTYEGISWSQYSGYYYILSPATVTDLSGSLQLSGTVGQSSPDYGSTTYQTANFISPPIHTNGYTKLKFTAKTSASSVTLGVGYCVGRPSGAVNWMTGYASIRGTSSQSVEVPINSSSDIEIYLAFRLTSTVSPAVNATANITKIEFV